MATHEHYLASYYPAWVDKPRDQVVEELASYSLETKRIPDPYFFLLGEKGKLISPQTGRDVDDSIERDSYIGRLEFQAFEKIEDWANLNQEGRIIWISPPSPDRSADTKIIVTEILKNQKSKILFNRAILTNLSGAECLELARSLGLPEIADPDELRSNPISIPDNWMEILEEQVENPEVWKAIKAKSDIEEKQKALRDSQSIYDALFGFGIIPAQNLARSLGLFGNNQGSCPPGQGAFTTFWTNSMGPEGSFPCPKCQRSIPSGLGITKCPHCGITKEAFGSNCD